MKCQSATSDKLTAWNWQADMLPGSDPEMQNPVARKIKLRREFSDWKRNTSFLWTLTATTVVVVIIVSAGFEKLQLQSVILKYSYRNEGSRRKPSSHT